MLTNRDDASDTNHQRTTGAAAMARSAVKNPLQVLVNAIDNDPTMPTERLFQTWWGAVKDDEDLMRAVGRHAFHNMLASLDRDKRKARERRRGQRAVSKAAVAMIKDRIRSVVLMDLLLPNGKKLRDSTFAECSAAGGWFKQLATRGKPSQIVGKVLTEADLQKISAVRKRRAA